MTAATREREREKGWRRDAHDSAGKACSAACSVHVCVVSAVYLYMCSDFSYKSRLIEIEEKPTS